MVGVWMWVPLGRESMINREPASIDDYTMSGSYILTLQAFRSITHIVIVSRVPVQVLSNNEIAKNSYYT